tara:strand:- start:1522 stop:1938 length:417 start_codon:yes stop_codon:yes gene_type:complete
MSYYTDHGEILYQIRLNATEEFTITEDLKSMLEIHDASLICQYDAFVNFVKECETNDKTNNPLYRWTKETVEDEIKKIKYKNIYSVIVNNQQVYKEEIADLIINKIKKFNLISIVSIDKFDTQPKNNPQPPKKFRNKP